MKVNLGKIGFQRQRAPVRMLLVTRRGVDPPSRPTRDIFRRGDDPEALCAVGAVGGGEDGGGVQDDAAAKIHVVNQDGDDLVRVLIHMLSLSVTVTVVRYPLHGERVDVARVLEEQVGEYDDAVLHAAISVDPWETLDRSLRLCG